MAANPLSQEPPEGGCNCDPFSFEGTGYQVQGFIHPGGHASSSTSFHALFMSLKTFQIFSD
jgi:hypothetical protein